MNNLLSVSYSKKEEKKEIKTFHFALLNPQLNGIVLSGSQNHGL